jgi:hypothetical protein
MDSSDIFLGFVLTIIGAMVCAVVLTLGIVIGNSNMNACIEGEAVVHGKNVYVCERVMSLNEPR